MKGLKDVTKYIESFLCLRALILRFQVPGFLLCPCGFLLCPGGFLLCPGGFLLCPGGFYCVQVFSLFFPGG